MPPLCTMVVPYPFLADVFAISTSVVQRFHPESPEWHKNSYTNMYSSSCLLKILGHPTPFYPKAMTHGKKNPTSRGIMWTRHVVLAMIIQRLRCFLEFYYHLTVPLHLSLQPFMMLMHQLADLSFLLLVLACMNDQH